jgi:7-cyano-7-deazaguanine synthase
VIVLLSGGLDSTLCLAMEEGPSAGFFVDYGQPNVEQERKAVRQIASRLGLVLYVVETTLPFAINRDDPAMYVPGRNAILLSLAATLGKPLVFGANADDFANYPDCRPEFFHAAEQALGVAIHLPLIDKTKPEIGKMATEMRLPVDWTWSCYFPRDDKPCGECDACMGRAWALA